LATQNDHSDEVRVWDLRTHRQRWDQPLRHENLTDLKMDADGKRLLSAGWDSVFKVWDISNGKLLASNEKATREYKYIMTSADFTMGGRAVLTWGNSRSFEVWDASTGTRRLAA